VQALRVALAWRQAAIDERLEAILALTHPFVERGQAGRAGDSGRGSPGSTVAVPVSPGHPRADLYKELGDLGL